MKEVLHVPTVRWSRFSPLSSLQRWLCRLKVEKLAAEKIWRLLFTDLMSTKGAEVGTFRGRLLSVWEKDSNNGSAAQANRSLGRDLETDMERRPNEEGLFGTTLKNILEVGRPKADLSKGPDLVGQPTIEALFEARASGGFQEVNCGRPDGEVFGFQLGSSPLALNITEFTDEALMEEASKYTVSYPWSLFSLGKPDFSSSSTLSGRDGVIVATNGGCGRDCSSETVGGADLGPLRMISDGREAEVSGLSGLANGTIEEEMEDASERVFQEVMEDRNEASEPCWQSNCLAKFSRCLGMPTEGFE